MFDRHHHYSNIAHPVEIMSQLDKTIITHRKDKDLFFPRGIIKQYIAYAYHTLLWLLSVDLKMKMVNNSWLGGNEAVGWKVQERLDKRRESLEEMNEKKPSLKCPRNTSQGFQFSND